MATLALWLIAAGVLIMMLAVLFSGRTLEEILLILRKQEHARKQAEEVERVRMKIRAARMAQRRGQTAGGA